jgi:hypothetical protein
LPGLAEGMEYQCIECLGTVTTVEHCFGGVEISGNDQ